MVNTTRAKYVFTIKEFSEGTPWIMAEPLNESVKLPNHGFLGFDLPKGTNMAKAKEIAKFMNDNLDQISLTTF